MSSDIDMRHLRVPISLNDMVNELRHRWYGSGGINQEYFDRILMTRSQADSYRELQGPEVRKWWEEKGFYTFRGIPITVMEKDEEAGQE